MAQRLNFALVIFFFAVTLSACASVATPTTHSPMTIDDFRRHIFQQRSQFEPRIQAAAKRISEKEQAGALMPCSKQILREAEWRVSFTLNKEKIESRVSDLEKSIDDANQLRALQQDPVDGSLGACFDEWFMRVDASTDYEGDWAIPPSFLDRINTPERLRTLFRTIHRFDILAPEEFPRVRADDLASSLTRFILRGFPKTYPYDPRLKTELVAALDEWQNKETGMWGVWITQGDTVLRKLDDVGITFHIVSYRNGQIAHLKEMGHSLLGLLDVDFPQGIRISGKYENHMNMDAVRLFRLAWPHMSENDKKIAATRIEDMLHWCLTSSMLQTGSFIVSQLDSTYSEAQRFGTKFLFDVGYFNLKNRFWTQQNFPEALTLAKKIKTNLELHNLKEPAIKEAHEIVQGFILTHSK